MGIAEKILSFMNQLNDGMTALKKRSEARLEEVRIEVEARNHIKTDNFSSETERRIMLEAAAREERRRAELSATLSGDPPLKKLFDEAFSRTPRDASTVMRLRIAEEVALETATRQRKLEEDLKDPKLRKYYEEALKRLEQASASQEKPKT